MHYFIKRLLLFFILCSSIVILAGCTFESKHISTVPSNGSIQSGDRFEIYDIQQQIGDKLIKNPEATYLQSQSLSNLTSLIDYLLSDFQYPKAAMYFQELITKTNDRDRAKLLTILINDLDPSSNHYTMLSGFLSNYVASGLINTDDRLFFDFTLKLLNNTFDKNQINTLTGRYTDFKNLLWQQYDMYYQYKDVPRYYLDGLFAIAYFKHQDFGVAKSLADRAIISNPRYILPYQIKAYVGVLTRNTDDAQKALNVLMEVDKTKLEWYQFLLGLMYYNQNDISQAKNYFLQTKSPTLRVEGLRYLIDMEKQQLRTTYKDNQLLSTHNKAIQRYFDELFDTTNQGKLQPIDFQTLFDRYLYDKIQVGEKGTLAAKEFYTTYPTLLDSALTICTKILSDDNYICDYGQGAKLFLQSRNRDALKSMIPLVKNYPQWQTYYIIGLLYQEQGLLENTKAYFGKALHFIDERNKKPLASMMVELLNTETSAVNTMGNNQK